MLTGQKKTDYQRKYMRDRRLKLRSTIVRPNTLKQLDPVIDADGNRIYEEG